MVTPFITTPYISRVLGPDGVGTYSYTTSIVAYFILLASLGIASYAQREIAFHQEDVHAQSRIFYEVVGIRAITVSISLLSYYLIISHCDVEDKVIYWVQAINILVVLFDISWFFQGLEEFGKIVLRNFVIRILSIAGIFLLIHDASDLLLYIGLMAVMNFLGAVSIWLYLPKYLVRVARNEINPFRNFVVIVQMFLPQIAIQIYTVFDKNMIGILTGSAFENGYYEQAEKIVKIGLMLVTSLGPVMLPRIASAYAHNDMEAIHHYIMRSYRFVWMIGLPMMFVTIGLIDTAVPWFFGPGYEKVGLLVKIFSGLLLAIGINNVTGVQYLISVNKQNTFTLTVLLGAIINFCLNMILIPSMESTGAAIASVAAETAIALV
ncbi:MAG: flippase, partial [Selenomonadaceae bacterium]|nr:flippase [Selenomonadaceae bacterium]